MGRRTASAIERIALGPAYGFAPPLSVGERPIATSNPRTLKLAAYSVEDAHGRRAAFFEKAVKNRPSRSRTAPEALFYEHVLPHWTFMQGRACAVHDVRHGLASTTVITAAAAPEGAGRPTGLLDEVLTLLPDMQASGAALLTSGRLDPEVVRRLDFYHPSLSRGDHARRVGRLAANEPVARLLAGRGDALVANMDALAAASRSAPRAICHLDLLRDNVFPGPEGPILIDWGEVAAAPAGFEYGGLFASMLRSGRMSKRRDALGGMWEALRVETLGSADRESTLLSAYYYFLFRIVSQLAAFRRDDMASERAALLAEILADASRETFSPSDALSRVRSF